MANHPITPPSELLQQWATEYWGNPGDWLALTVLHHLHSIADELEAQ